MVEWKQLGDIMQIVRGASPRPIQHYLTNSSDGINWIKIGDVLPDDKYITQTNEKITLEGARKSRVLHKGDFILSGIDEKGLLQAVDVAVEMVKNGDLGIPVPDYIDENVKIQMQSGKSDTNMDVEIKLRSPIIDKEYEDDFREIIQIVKIYPKFEFRE